MADSLSICRFWDTLSAPQAFLDYDRANPARAAAAAIVAAEVVAGARTLVEIGPGPGYDYRDYFSRIGGLIYAAYEGSALMRATFLKAAPEADVRLGGFDDLIGDRAFDIVYTKATLEHQPDFRSGLGALLRAARRLVLVNWYMPPQSGAWRPCVGVDGVFYNTYRKQDVMDFIRGQDPAWSVDEHQQPPPGNSLWLVRRSAT